MKKLIMVLSSNKREISKDWPSMNRDIDNQLHFDLIQCMLARDAKVSKIMW